MYLIPELQTIILLNPRAASGALCSGIQKRWPKAMLLYRHMEADGAPAGYEAWRKIGVIRQPLQRLWSHYKFYRRIAEKQWPLQALWRSLDMPFERWLLTNRTPLFPSLAALTRDPSMHTLHPTPENLKSQSVWLRPDLGAKIYRFEDELAVLADALDIPLAHENASEISDPPELDPPACAHLEKVFAWDFQFYEARIASPPAMTKSLALA